MSPTDPAEGAAVLADFDAELYGLVFGVPMGVLGAHGVLRSLAPIRGTGLSWRTRNTPPGRLDLAPDAPPGDECAREGSIGKVERKRIVEHTTRPRRRHGPPLRAAVLV